MIHVVQDARRERLTRIVATASLAASAIYVTWRWGWSLQGTALWFSLPLVLAETYGLLVAALLTWVAWRLRERTPLPVLADRTVDVFVTTADEPIAIIRKTALAAREIRYPHTTWLLDDAQRDEVRAVAAEIGVRYLRRDGRSHGKAGNLNHALQHAEGEFILQLDADHVPLPQIVDRLLGFFVDERLAVAQSPQDFYDTDGVANPVNGRGRQLWGDQHLFFNVIQPGKDRLGAAMFVGSCALLRRAAIDDVGGFATGTTIVGTETSLLLHARGWRSAYLGEHLAFGLAPATARAYQRQQVHRARGAMQALRRYPPLAQRGLTLAQRVEYFHSLTAPLGSLQRLVFYLAPIVFLTTGVFPLRASLGLFALLFVPTLLLRGASFHLLTRGQGTLLSADRYWMAKWFTHLAAVRSWFAPARQAPLPAVDESASVPLRTVAPQLALIGLTAAALGWASFARTLGYGSEVPGWGPTALVAAVLLALWHAGLAAHVVQLSLAGRHRRGEVRFHESLSVALRVFREDGKLSSTDIAMTEDLTPTGVALRCMYPIREGGRVELTLPLSGGNVSVRGHVVRHGVSETQFGTVHLAGVEFDGIDRGVRDAIELHCAQHAMPIDRQRRDAVGARALRRLRELRGEQRVDVGMPAHVRVGTGDEARDIGVGLLEDVSPRGGRVVLDHPVEEGAEIALQIPGSSIAASGRVVFVHALKTGLGMRFVAGFQTDAPPAAERAGRAVAVPWYAGLGDLLARGAGALRTGSRTAGGALARSSRSVGEAGTRAAARLGAGSRAVAARVSEGARMVAARPPAEASVQTLPEAVERIALAPAAVAPPVAVAEAEAVADPDRVIEMEIDGEFTFPFELAVGATVRIAEGGRARADISAVHAIVLGAFTGTLRASRTITVGRTARVEGSLLAPEVQIADGALVNGVRAGFAGDDAQTFESRASDDHFYASSSIRQEGSSAEADDFLTGDDATTAAPAQSPPAPASPAPDSPPAQTADDEIFVASPIFTDGVSHD